MLLLRFLVGGGLIDTKFIYTQCLLKYNLFQAFLIQHRWLISQSKGDPKSPEQAPFPPATTWYPYPLTFVVSVGAETAQISFSYKFGQYDRILQEIPPRRFTPIDFKFGAHSPSFVSLPHPGFQHRAPSFDLISRSLIKLNQFWSLKQFSCDNSACDNSAIISGLFLKIVTLIF